MQAVQYQLYEQDTSENSAYSVNTAHKEELDASVDDNYHQYCQIFLQP